MSLNGSTSNPTNGELAILVDELARRMEQRERSSEGLRVKVEAVENQIDKHEKLCGERWGELTGGMRVIKYGLGLLLTMVSLVIGILALKH